MINNRFSYVRSKNRHLLTESMPTKIDHIVIGAESLRQGVDYVRNLLGVDIPYGGEHQKMGTHNHLMKLGGNVFFEIIAVHNEIEPPSYPRWFGLDDPFVRKQIEIQPTLLTWVVNTGDINQLIKQAKYSLGEPTLINRGNLKWYFGLPDDGRLLGGGMLPYAIEWLTEKHPSADMADLGCCLDSLEIRHPYTAWLESALESIGVLNLVKIVPLPKNEAPYLIAHIRTPNGKKDMCSCKLSINH